MKKYHITLLLLLSSFYLVACGSSTPADEPIATVEPTAEVVVVDATEVPVEAEPEMVAEDSETMVEEAVVPEEEPYIDPFDRKSIDLITLPDLDFSGMDLDGKTMYDDGLVPLSFYYPEGWAIEEDSRKYRVYLRNEATAVPGETEDDDPKMDLIIVAAVATNYPRIPPADLKKPPKPLLRNIGELMGIADSDTNSIQIPFELTVGNGIEASQMEVQSAPEVLLRDGTPANMYGNMTVVDIFGVPYVVYGVSTKENMDEMKLAVDELLNTLQYSDAFKDRTVE